MSITCKRPYKTGQEINVNGKKWVVVHCASIKGYIDTYKVLLALI